MSGSPTKHTLALTLPLKKPLDLVLSGFSGTVVEKSPCEFFFIVFLYLRVFLVPLQNWKACNSTTVLT